MTDEEVESWSNNPLAMRPILPLTAAIARIRADRKKIAGLEAEVKRLKDRINKG